MLRILVPLLFISNFAFANELLDAEPEDVKEIYEYCLSLQDNAEVDNKSLLECINSELSALEYKTFGNVDAVKSYIKNVE